MCHAELVLCYYWCRTFETWHSYYLENITWKGHSVDSNVVNIHDQWGFSMHICYQMAQIRVTSNSASLNVHQLLMFSLSSFAEPPSSGSEANKFSHYSLCHPSVWSLRKSHSFVFQLLTLESQTQYFSAKFESKCHDSCGTVCVCYRTYSIWSTHTVWKTQIRLEGFE